MLALVTVLVVATTPPLIPAEGAPAPLPLPSEADDRPLPPPPPVKKPPPPLPPARLALWLSPLSLFALTLWVEPEVHLAGGLSVFVNVGGGPLGQLGGDLGLRYAINGLPFQGFYLDLRAQLFTLPVGGLVMLGPGMQVGHAWRTPRVAISVAVGFVTWVGVHRQDPRTQFFTFFTTDEQVIVLPGVTQPPPGMAAVQPTLRFSFGPTF
jgi:hypothetical protein